MKLQRMVQHLQALAAETLAESWDKVGLHVGAADWRVRRGLLCIDLTEAVMAEATEANADLIVAYHPPIFQPLERLTDVHWKQRVVLEAARRGISVYSPHTALDAAPGGVNDWLAGGIGEGEVKPIKSTPPPAHYKLVTFVPVDRADQLRQALSHAGAGIIGDYTQCSYGTPGEGTFLGGDSTIPAIGRRGRLERVAELRMEMLVPAAKLSQVLAVHHASHPYEEPAVDVYKLEPQPGERAATGAGRVVTLKRAISMGTLVERIRKHLGVVHLEVGRPEGKLKIRRVGLCAGAGGSLLEAAGEIDAFFTGEMRHHDVLDAASRGIGIVLAGHTQTERPYLKVYRKNIRKMVAPEVEWLVSKADVAATKIV